MTGLAQRTLDRLRRRVGSGEDGGSIIPLIPAFVLGLFILGGIVVDGSRELNARGEAQAYAEEAARAGATAVDLTSPTLALQPSLALQRVEQYCNSVQDQPDSAVTACGPYPDDTHFISATQGCDGQPLDIVVTVRVETRIDTTLLGIVGVTQMSAGGQASARPVIGIETGGSCAQ